MQHAFEQKSVPKAEVELELKRVQKALSCPGSGKQKPMHFECITIYSEPINRKWRVQLGQGRVYETQVDYAATARLAWVKAPQKAAAYGAPGTRQNQPGALQDSPFEPDYVYIYIYIYIHIYIYIYTHTKLFGIQEPMTIYSMCATCVCIPIHINIGQAYTSFLSWARYRCLASALTKGRIPMRVCGFAHTRRHGKV